MAVTYKLIQTIIVGAGGAANIDFTSIPATYTDLALLISGRTNQATTTSNLLIQFNNDTGSNYYSIDLWGNGSTVQNDFASPSAYIYAGPMLNGSVSTASVFGNAIAYIPNYAGNTAKTLSVDGVTDDNATTRYTVLHSGRWTGTSAITSLKVFSGGSANLTQYSSMSLYGINKS